MAMDGHRDILSKKSMMAQPPSATAEQAPPPTWAQRGWMAFCRLLVRIFYRRFESAGLENLPAKGPVILCANHVNALVDALVIQAASPRPIHPIARSGLFRNPLLRPILAMIQAVPIYRKPAAGQAAGSNEDSFERCFEYLAEGRVILIFPEGQSHSDPSLRPLKTGAARLALGHLERHGKLPRVLPAGLTFSKKGRFRGNVLVELGAPLPFATAEGETKEEETKEEKVRRYTEEIELGLERVTLNADSWEDVALLDLLQRFFTLRDTVKQAGAKGRVALAEKYRSLRRLLESHRALRAYRPAEVEQLRLRLKQFDKLRRRFGVKDYQLHLDYRFGTVLRFLGYTLVWILLIFPLALWGLVFSGPPYIATLLLARSFARGRDQVDTASLLIGLFLYPLTWVAETAVVDYYFGWKVALVFGLLLPPTAALALKLGHERKKIQEEIRVYWMFSRKRGIQAWLREQRAELEVEVARIARLAREAGERLRS
jgi:glycerol-3-phosphate O-acyltransferase/dihydroxyacetone phosphate acyltransferase